MARYWILGTGDWSDTDHWSETSGGSGGADAPTSTDDVFIDSNSGFGAGGTITLDGEESNDCHDFIATSGHSYTIISMDLGLSIYGSLTAESGITWDGDAGINLMSVSAETIMTNGSALVYLTIYEIGSWELQDNLEMLSGFTTANGTFDANDHNVTANYFYLYADTGYTPTVIMGSGTWEATGSDGWYIEENNGEVVTVTPETSTIKLTGETAIFFGEGKVYNNLWLDSTTHEMTIYGENTFNDLIATPGATIQFIGGETQTFLGDFPSGEVGNLVSIITYPEGLFATGSVETPGTGYEDGSQYRLNDENGALIEVDSVDESGGILSFHLIDPGTNLVFINWSVSVLGGNEDSTLVVDSLTLARHILSKSSGIVNCDYLDISDSNATGGARWRAGNHSINDGNNRGWAWKVAPMPSRVPTIQLS